jgi:hypothetical protein
MDEIEKSYLSDMTILSASYNNMAITGSTFQTNDLFGKRSQHHGNNRKTISLHRLLGIDVEKTCFNKGDLFNDLLTLLPIKELISNTTNMLGHRNKIHG